MNDVVDLNTALSSIDAHWQPVKVAQFNECDVMVVKVKGTFHWHKHLDTDDFFLVLNGCLTIKTEKGDVTLEQGALYVVPKGMEHCPVAEEEASILLIEPTGTDRTGD